MLCHHHKFACPYSPNFTSWKILRFSHFAAAQQKYNMHINCLFTHPVCSSYRKKFVRKATAKGFHMVQWPFQNSHSLWFHIKIWNTQYNTSFPMLQLTSNWPKHKLRVKTQKLFRVTHACCNHMPFQKLFVGIFTCPGLHIFFIARNMLQERR